MQNLAIICVDDESVVLDGLRSQLERAFGKEHFIEIAQSGEEALDVIGELKTEGHEIAVLITDQLMPGMKGSELLKESCQQCPNTLNIMLTGQAGADEVGEAVNNGNLYRYIAKPWESSDLLLTVKEALNSYRKDRKLEEQNILLAEANRDLEQKILDRTVELAKEKERTDRLLRNILPEKVAMELMETGQTQPTKYDEVTVLFSDFENFTNIVASIPVRILVEELNEIFSEFDEIMESHGIEKIQTVGDAYLAVCGLPDECGDHAVKCTRAARQMLDYIEKRNATSAVKWAMRMGLHSGPVAAGVVGKRKFAYNLFGDTINIAARIEAAGERGKVNVSASTYYLIRQDFECEYRGKISAKGKGDLDMYFVKYS